MKIKYVASALPLFGLLILIASMRKATPHAPIHINGNADFATQASTEGWLGNGTAINPYIIQNYEIDGNGGAYCIWIENTSVYFVIRNCAFYNAISSWPAPYGVGICLKNVTKGRLENNKCYDNIYGIRLTYYSSNNTITNNDCYENNKGICLDDSSNNNVASNNCYNNSEGIYLDDSSNNIVANNKCYGNLNGISLYSSSEKNIIANNTCYENSFAGIHLYHYLMPGYPSNNSIENNKCYKNREGIYLSSSHNNSITNCSVYNNSYGFRISSSNIQIHYCNIYGNPEYGIFNEISEQEYEVNATHCWWGHGSGPYHKTNTNGQGDNVSEGDNVSDYVLFIPWLEKTSVDSITTEKKKGIPGFELIAIVGAIAFIILNRRKK